MKPIDQIRRDYTRESFTESELDPDPLAQFRTWFDEAAITEGDDVNGMSLATVDAGGAPSARIVLLKGVDHGFLFYTNYESRKGRELAANPRAALVFWWRSLDRQVRIEGRVERIDAATCDAYFAGRPRGSRIGAVASPQSSVIESREALEERVARVIAEIGESEEIARPESWGGYRLVPEAIEFWQGRPDRVHDRLRYRRADDGWLIERLAP